VILALRVLRGLPVRLDRKAPLVHKDQKEIRAQPARQVPLGCLELQETQAPLAQQGLLVQLDRPGRKALRDLLARVEGLTAGRNFRAAGLSSCRLESAG